MSTKLYPRYQHARIDGEAMTRVIRDPKDEQPDVWKESPADCEGDLKPEATPAHNGIPCADVDTRFNEAWDQIVAEKAELADQLSDVREQYEALQIEHQHLTLAHERIKAELKRAKGEQPAPETAQAAAPGEAQTDAPGVAQTDTPAEAQADAPKPSKKGRKAQ